MLFKRRNKGGDQGSRGHNIQKPSWHIGNKLQGIDMFGREVPSFNLRGETHINTKVGGLVSVVILITTLMYTAIKLELLYSRKDPTISESEIVNWYAQEDKVNLDAINFKFAFSIEGFVDRKNKNDPRYLRQYLQYINYH